MISKSKANEISLTAQQYAYVMSLPAKVARERFLDYFGTDKMPPNAEIPVTALGVHHDEVKAVDPRFDGVNALVFRLMLMGPGYKKYLNEKSFIKQGKLGGGKSVYYKLLTAAEIKKISQIFKEKRKFLGMKDPEDLEPAPATGRKRRMRRTGKEGGEK